MKKISPHCSYMHEDTYIYALMHTHAPTHAPTHTYSHPHTPKGLRGDTAQSIPSKYISLRNKLNSTSAYPQQHTDARTY